MKKIQNSNDIEMKKNKIHRIVYIMSIILSIIALIFALKKYEISKVKFFIPVILFILSITFRLFQKKKISNIICIISVAIVCIITLSNIMNENYNKQFLEYQINTSAYLVEPRYVNNVEGLINTAIKNNKIGKKVTFVYENTEYTSEEELKQLLGKLNINKTYFMYTKYNDDNEYSYIESIILSKYINPELNTILKYEGEENKGSDIKNLIQELRIAVDLTKKKVKITYISDKNQIIIDNNDTNEIFNLNNQIEMNKKYDVEIQDDIDLCNIIIKIHDYNQD